MAKKKKQTLKEFSKKVIFAMIILWFLGAFFGGVIVAVQGYGLESLLEFIKEPMSVGILGYLLKSAFENNQKIKNSVGCPK